MTTPEELPTPDELPSYADVQDAAARIESAAHRTPVLRSRLIDQQVGAQVVVKCENFQRAGAFKFRGAFNALARFSPQQRRAGVVSYSSGNHAQALALAASLLDLPATIVMPLDAPAAKLAATQSYGGRIVSYDRYRQDREQLGRELAERDGLTLIPPFDHPDVIAGQGTAAQELFEQAGPLDALFVPLGGGGLLSGTALATRALAPGCVLYGVEPETADHGLRSMRAGRIITIDPPRTIADGAQVRALGRYTFPVIRRDVDQIVTVSDGELVTAMRLLATRMKLVVEPTGCLALAAVLRLAPRLAGQRVGVLISGGNVDLDRFAGLLVS